jgi:hypothetical protein
MASWCQPIWDRPTDVSVWPGLAGGPRPQRPNHDWQSTHGHDGLISLAWSGGLGIGV